jgi:hypothetical protein
VHSLKSPGLLKAWLIDATQYGLNVFWLSSLT